MRRTLALTLGVVLVSFTAFAASRQAEVQAVWYAERGGEAVGGTSPVMVRVADNGSGRPSVGVVEEYLGGAGDMWRAAAWLAAFNASRGLGRPFHEHEFVVSSVGHIDGPSAGMLMTATMMALLNGVAVRSDTTMTGTVNPDGSAGPVGGIPQKMEGAARRGIKRFGYPIGARLSVDIRTQKPVDLVKLGRKLGVQAVEVRDQWQAYELLTGRPLAPPAQLDDTAMRPSVEYQAAVGERVVVWIEYATRGMTKLEAAYKALPPSLQRSAEPLIEDANRLMERGTEYAKAGRVIAAHEENMRGIILYRMADASMRHTREALALDVKAVIGRVVKERHAAYADLQTLYEEAAARRPDQSVDGVVNAVAALSDAVRAQAFLEMSREHERKAEASLAKNNVDVTSLGEALTLLASARGMVALARERLALFPVMRSSAATKHEVLVRHARAYGSAGSAALSYFEAVLLDGQAEAQGVSAGVLHQAAAAKFMEYRIARTTSAIALGADSLVEPPVIARVLELAAGAESYLEAAGLVNKLYSLDASLGEDGRWRVGQKQAFEHQLRLARDRAKGAAARAQRAVGAVPSATRWYFALGEARAEGDDDDRLLALENYWTATVLADLATSLTQS